MAGNRDSKTPGAGGPSCVSIGVAFILIFIGVGSDQMWVAAIGLVMLIVMATRVRARQKQQQDARTSGAGESSSWRRSTADAMVSSWGQTPDATTARYTDVWRGRAYKRTVHLFNAAGDQGEETWLVIDMRRPLPAFGATSDGARHVRVHGEADEVVREAVKQWGARNMLEMGSRGHLLFTLLPPVPASELPQFAAQRVPALVQAATVLDDAPAPATPATQPEPEEPPSPDSAAPRPPTPTPQNPVHEGLLTPANERPALEPAEPDPVAASLTPLALDWQPLEWKVPDLGVTSGEGWKPREWTPPTYGWQSPDSTIAPSKE